MKTNTSVDCAYCGKKVVKLASEVKRRRKVGKDKFYCNNNCAGKHKAVYVLPYKDNFKKQKYTRQPDKFANFRWYIKNVIKNSKKRNQDYDIDLEYLKQLWEGQCGICPFTQQKLELRTHSYKNKKHPYSASLDRIDNTKGYIKGNVRFVSLIFNYAKNTFEDQQVLDFCKKIVLNISE